MVRENMVVDDMLLLLGVDEQGIPLNRSGVKAGFDLFQADGQSGNQRRCADSAAKRQA
jgi:hypothetical protein